MYLSFPLGYLLPAGLAHHTFRPLSSPQGAPSRSRLSHTLSRPPGPAGEVFHWSVCSESRKDTASAPTMPKPRAETAAQREKGHWNWVWRKSKGDTVSFHLLAGAVNRVSSARGMGRAGVSASFFSIYTPIPDSLLGSSEPPHLCPLSPRSQEALHMSLVRWRIAGKCGAKEPPPWP